MCAPEDAGWGRVSGPCWVGPDQSSSPRVVRITASRRGVVHVRPRWSRQHGRARSPSIDPVHPRLRQVLAAGTSARAHARPAPAAACAASAALSTFVCQPPGVVDLASGGPDRLVVEPDVGRPRARSGRSRGSSHRTNLGSAGSPAPGSVRPVAWRSASAARSRRGLLRHVTAQDRHAAACQASRQAFSGGTRSVCRHDAASIEVCVRLVRSATVRFGPGAPRSWPGEACGQLNARNRDHGRSFAGSRVALPPHRPIAPGLLDRPGAAQAASAHGPRHAKPAAWKRLRQPTRMAASAAPSSTPARPRGTAQGRPSAKRRQGRARADRLRRDRQQSRRLSGAHGTARPPRAHAPATRSRAQGALRREVR